MIGVDGTRRPIYLGAKGQYILDDGVWLIPEEECYELPIIVNDAPATASIETLSLTRVPSILQNSLTLV
jgi:hypothetical protein